MAWLAFTAFVLFIVGFFVPGRTGLVLCIAGLAALFAGFLLRKPRGVRKASIGSDGNFLDMPDRGVHDSNDGGHGRDGHR